MSGTEERDLEIRVTLARLEAKVDVAITRHTAEIATLTAARDDHESRIRRIESRSFVSPRQVYAAVLLATAITSTATGLLAIFLT